MSISEAALKLREGLARTMRRKSWQKGFYVEPFHGRGVMRIVEPVRGDNKESNWTPQFDDLWADDWETDGDN